MSIENFRSIAKLECSFDEVTTFIGPNGAGKSTMLRALDWFFNGEKGQVDERDVHAGSNAKFIRIRVDFDSLTDADRDALGSRYCPGRSNTFTAWKTWDNGSEKITGRALAYAPFESIRSIVAAVEKRKSYSELQKTEPDLKLPNATSAAAVAVAMDEWERANPGKLTEAEVSDTHFFGFNSQGKLSELFDYVFVSADLRADAETSDSRDSILGRILQRALDREALNVDVEKLTSAYALAYGQMNAKYLGPQLEEISEKLSARISQYTQGRSILLSPTAPTIKPQLPRVEVAVSDGAISTPVYMQGHGLQRTLLLSALTVLSESSRKADGSGQIFLAIEEPELFQHPTQARAFASVLRSLASDSQNLMQIAYATHSPHFIEPLHFDQIRRVTNVKMLKAPCAATKIKSATIDEIVNDLRGYVDPKSIQRRWSQACLKYLPEALFAEAVILVEGEEDAAIFQGLGDHPNEMAIDGIAVAPVSGKSNLLLPFAILKRLGITGLMVADNDSGCRRRMERDKKEEGAIVKAEAEHARINRSLCRFVGGQDTDYPIGAVTPELAFVPDTLETLLASDLPGWDLTRRQLIKDGRGVDGKNAATYELASKECTDQPSKQLASILALVRHARAA